MGFEDIHELLHSLSDNERSKILSDELTRLPIEKRAEIVAQQLPQGLSVVLGGNNVVNSTFAFQVNSNPGDISELLKNLPPETLAELIRAATEAIASRIK